MGFNTSKLEPNDPLLLNNRFLCNSQQFEVCVANTSKLREEVFKIRYQVYCQELGYECLSRFPDKLERDAYDSCSVHLLLKYKPKNIYIGCVRLVLSSNSLKPQFPFENICNDHFLDFNHIPRSYFGEVSRLAVLREFRHWNQKICYGDFNGYESKLFNKRHLSIIPLILYLAVTSIVSDLGLPYAISFMEPRLSRQLKLCGLHSFSCGKFIEFKGTRGLFLMKTSHAINNINKDIYLYNLFKAIQANLIEVK
ncbi:MAG: PEP-CTERM/exosortase system-associated acyltransferase [Cyanobacterium sp.]